MGDGVGVIYKDCKMEINVVNKYKHLPTSDDFYIGRGSPLGNPFFHKTSSFSDVTKVESREGAIKAFELYLHDEIGKKNKKIIKELNRIGNHILQGNPVNLVCFCKPKECHGDVIKKVILSKLQDYHGKSNNG